LRALDGFIFGEEYVTLSEDRGMRGRLGRLSLACAQG
jgi:hypothetical protein